MGKTEFFTAIILSAVCAYFLGVIAGAHQVESSYRKMMIEMGVAKWVVDEKTGKTSFVITSPIQE